MQHLAHVWQCSKVGHVLVYQVIGWGAADSVHVEHNHKATRVLTLASSLAIFGSSAVK